MLKRWTCFFSQVDSIIGTIGKHKKLCIMSDFDGRVLRKIKDSIVEVNLIEIRFEDNKWILQHKAIHKYTLHG